MAVLMASGPQPQPQPLVGVLDEHPSIAYASRPTTDRVGNLSRALADGERSGHFQPFQRDPRTGYLVPVLDALGISAESQLLVFSKTGVQRAYTSPRNPRALFFNASVVVGYVPGAPVLEIASHDPQQGVVFYTLDQAGPAPVFKRAMVCLTCHVSASTLEVPGMIVRSNTVADDGSVMPQYGSNDVNHQTPHPDRWGGWFVTSEGSAAPYSQRAHAGNITYSTGGITSNQVFVDWLGSSPERRGYLSSSSDIVGLLLFDHEMHAINLLTRLNWESRVQNGESRGLDPFINALADYLLFVGEAPPAVPLTARKGFAEHLEARTPTDRRGRSFGQLDLVDRLLRYPCSYMVYSPAFDGLPAPVRQAVYRRMLDILIRGLRPPGAIRGALPPGVIRAKAEDRRAVLEILRDTKPDFPAATRGEAP